MKRSSKTILIVLAALAAIGCWAFRSPAPAPSTEEIAPAEKEAALKFLRETLAVTHERSAYSGKRKFLKLAANPRNRQQNNETFKLLRETRVAPETQWKVLRHKQNGALELSFRDERNAQIIVMLEKHGAALKVAGAMEL